MIVTPSIYIVDGNLMVLGQCILSKIHGNITLNPALGVGIIRNPFLGAMPDESKSHHIFPIWQFK